jgi:5-methylcytosine-specific restriction protein A
MCEKLFVVDLYSGSYTKKFTGHEIFNLKKNLDGMYYGYVPPHGNIGYKKNTIEIKNIDENAKDLNSVDGVLVVYVKAISPSNRNRKIIAFCENATVYRKPQSGKHLKRKSPDTGKIVDYQIKSDNLTDLRKITQEHIIESAKDNIFRAQRSVLNKHPELKQGIIAYIKEIKKQNNLDRDSEIEQENLQRENPASPEDSARYGSIPDEIEFTPYGKRVKKKSSIAKKVIVDSNYKCLYDESHTTFLTSKGKQYMEGHHLIPCTVTNSEFFKEKSKLDREENIVSICPTCHRAIHFGNTLTKQKIVEKLYYKQKAKLESVGLDISLETILSKYLVEVE